VTAHEADVGRWTVAAVPGRRISPGPPPGPAKPVQEPSPGVSPHPDAAVPPPAPASPHADEGPSLCGEDPHPLAGGRPCSSGWPVGRKTESDTPRAVSTSSMSCRGRVKYRREMPVWVYIQRTRCLARRPAAEQPAPAQRLLLVIEPSGTAVPIPRIAKLIRSYLKRMGRGLRPRTSVTDQKDQNKKGEEQEGATPTLLPRHFLFCLYPFDPCTQSVYAVRVPFFLSRLEASDEGNCEEGRPGRMPTRSRTRRGYRSTCVTAVHSRRRGPKRRRCRACQRRARPGASRGLHRPPAGRRPPRLPGPTPCPRP